MQTLGQVIRTPPIPGNPPVETTEGVLTLILIGGFFLLNACGEKLIDVHRAIQAGVTGLKIQLKSHKQKQTRHAEKQEIIGKTPKVLVFVRLEEPVSPTALQLYKNFVAYGGAAISAPDGLLTFSDPEQAMAYAKDLTQGVLEHYAMLRPMDPQPPFFVVIHCVDSDTPTQSALNQVTSLLPVMKKHQILLTHRFKTLVEVQTPGSLQALNSLGFYDFPAFGKTVEVFNLSY